MCMLTTWLFSTDLSLLSSGVLTCVRATYLFYWRILTIQWCAVVCARYLPVLLTYPNYPVVCWYVCALPRRSLLTYPNYPVVCWRVCALPGCSQLLHQLPHLLPGWLPVPGGALWYAGHLLVGFITNSSLSPCRIIRHAILHSLLQSQQ
jgi:hypothetical protein